MEIPVVTCLNCRKKTQVGRELCSHCGKPKDSCLRLRKKPEDRRAA
jgi:hypothetical protein